MSFEEDKKTATGWLQTFIIVFTICTCMIVTINQFDRKANVQMESTQNISYFLDKLLHNKEYFNDFKKR